MSPEGGQRNASFAATGESGICAVAVALHSSGKITGDDWLQTSRGPVGGPAEAQLISAPGRLRDQS